MWSNTIPGATTSVKDGPCPFLGTPVTLYPLIGPWAGLHLTVTLLSFTSITSISEGESTAKRAGWKNGEKKGISAKRQGRRLTTNGWSCFPQLCMCECKYLSCVWRRLVCWMRGYLLYQSQHRQWWCSQCQASSYWWWQWTESQELWTPLGYRGLLHGLMTIYKVTTPLKPKSQWLVPIERTRKNILEKTSIALSSPDSPWVIL